MSRTTLLVTLVSALLLALAVGACRHGTNEKQPSSTKEQVQEVEKAAPAVPATPEVKDPATADPAAATDPAAADKEKEKKAEEGTTDEAKPAPKPAEPAGGEAE